MGFNAPVGIGWPASSYTGWGVYALNLTLQLLKMKRNPIWISAPVDLEMDETFLSIAKKQILLEEAASKTGSLEFDFPVLHALRNDFRPSLDEQLARGSINIGVIFFENTEFSEMGIKRAQDYDLIITGSSWNMELLKKSGIYNVVNIFQGVDTELFSPSNKSKKDPDKFIVFSGGKFEYRKGQDAVISAFKRFYFNHPNALLVFAWENPWVEIVATIKNSALVEGVPEKTKAGVTDFSSWLKRNGLPSESFQDLGRVPNHKMPSVFDSADVAIFPNRCEAGTNLVAMEAMASGVPTILSSNTGHLDLLAMGFGHALPMGQAGLGQVHPEVCAAYGDDPLGLWGETDPDELLAWWLRIAENREQWHSDGRHHADAVRDLSWRNSMRKLLSYVESIPGK